MYVLVIVFFVQKKIFVLCCADLNFILKCKNVNLNSMYFS